MTLPRWASKRCATCALVGPAVCDCDEDDHSATAERERLEARIAELEAELRASRKAYDEAQTDLEIERADPTRLTAELRAEREEHAHTRDEAAAEAKRINDERARLVTQVECLTAELRDERADHQRTRAMWSVTTVAYALTEADRSRAWARRWKALAKALWTARGDIEAALTDAKSVESAARLARDRDHALGVIRDLRAQVDRLREERNRAVDLIADVRLALVGHDPDLTFAPVESAAADVLEIARRLCAELARVTATDTRWGVLQRHRDETERLRAELAEGNAAANKHLERLREMVWHQAPEKLQSSPGWTSGAECLDALEATIAELRAPASDVVRITDAEYAAARAVLRAVVRFDREAGPFDDAISVAHREWAALGKPLLGGEGESE